ncbi:MAG: hypothetical protein AB1589_16835 [Cyanobacteriota bacterium]
MIDENGDRTLGKIDAIASTDTGKRSHIRKERHGTHPRYRNAIAHWGRETRSHVGEDRRDRTSVFIN